MVQNLSGSVSSLTLRVSLGGLGSRVKADHESELPRGSCCILIWHARSDSQVIAVSKPHMRHLDLCERLASSKLIDAGSDDASDFLIKNNILVRRIYL